MRALLLAAGLGSRLQPLTKYLPKCLVPIHGRPLLDYWLETLLDHGVEEVLINTHYMASMVQKYLNQSTWLPYIKMVHEETLLGTGGTILRNRDFFQDETFLVAHADNLTIFDMQDFADQHATRPKGAELTMMVFKTPDPQSCGIVSLDNEGVVQAFHEKVANPPGDVANGAVYILEPSVVTWMAGLGKKQVDLSNEVIPYFLGKIFTSHNALYHRDIGTMKSWIEGNRDFFHMPATAIHKKAWSGILQEGDGSLAKVVEELLTSIK
ncbi:MAG TPA: mannose-1-phosphate guanylyltransferase [Gammaproteobacteria bacterium]|nr:mannose-1-phosphate guanylyltransferase [Gammaproteobacteria bacterium]